MPKLRELMAKVLADGKIDSAELESLTDLLYADHVIDRQEAHFLVELRSRVERVSPGFEKFYFQAIKQHLLVGGAIDAERVVWLESHVLPSASPAAKKKLLRELRGEASRTCPEFEALCQEIED